MKKHLFLSICMAALMVSGCSKVRDELGLNRNSPDEFTVVKRAPLTLPPEYNLRPPGAYDNAATRTAGTQAKDLVFGDSGAASARPSTGNEVFLSKAGAAGADPSIRTIVDRESGYISLQNRSTVDRILHRDPKAPDGIIVDAKQEAQRLKENLESGTPVNEGEVPVVEPKKSSTIDKLF